MGVTFFFLFREATTAASFTRRASVILSADRGLDLCEFFQGFYEML